MIESKKSAGGRERRKSLKTVVEEQEVQSTAQVISREQKSRPVSEVSFHQKPQPQASGAQSKTECFESCLDLAAEFLGRG